jgi:hypothetical protein
VMIFGIGYEPAGKYHYRKAAKILQALDITLDIITNIWFDISPFPIYT